MSEIREWKLTFGSVQTLSFTFKISFLFLIGIEAVRFQHSVDILGYIPFYHFSVYEDKFMGYGIF